MNNSRSTEPSTTHAERCRSLASRAALASTEAELARVIAGSTATERADAFGMLAAFGGFYREHADLMASPRYQAMQRLDGILNARGANMATRVIARVAFEWRWDQVEDLLTTAAPIAVAERKFVDPREAAGLGPTPRDGSVFVDFSIKISITPTPKDTRLLPDALRIVEARHFDWSTNAGLIARAKIHGVEAEDELFTAPDGSKWNKKHGGSSLREILNAVSWPKPTTVGSEADAGPEPQAKPATARSESGRYESKPRPAGKKR